MGQIVYVITVPTAGCGGNVCGANACAAAGFYLAVCLPANVCFACFVDVLPTSETKANLLRVAFSK